MNPNWAEENLQTIRTLMERSAVYRRALAPIMIYVGVIGIGGGVIGCWRNIDSARGFVFLWFSIAVVAIAGAFLLVRRQALKADEPFWSSPTRRVTHALFPALFVGAIAGLTSAWIPSLALIHEYDLPAVWILLYGCALQAAGFFMIRGVKFFGQLFLICGACLILARYWIGGHLLLTQNHTIMGEFFGGLHLAYGIYLYFTEKKTPVA